MHADDPDGPPAVTPYRPTISTPATLSAPGWLEGEFGGLEAFSSPDTVGSTPRFSVPYAIKYAFSPDWGVRVGGEALVRAPADDGRREVGIGDTNIVAKRRFAVDDDSAFGLEAGVLVPTARRALQSSSGKPDWAVNGIYSVDIGTFHADVNAIETRLGGHDAGASRWQTLGALAVSHPVSERWGVVGEVSGTHQPHAAGTAQFLGGASFNARRDVVFDLGAVRGLDRATPHWQAFAGVTVLLGRLR